MTVAAIRERLYDYIRSADDKKVEAMYTLLEDQIVPAWEWSEDEEFVAELNERVRRYEAGIDPAYSIEEVKEFLQQARQDRQQNSTK
jgi:hypothetical protein